MKTILVLIGGGDRDEVIIRTALAAAVPLSAHLDFLHVHVSPGVAAQYDSKVQFAMGAGIQGALGTLETKARTFSSVAVGHVREFCIASKIEICDAPTNGKNVTVRFREETDTTKERLVFLARQSDFVVLGRAKQKQGLSPDTLETLIMNCGRPVIVAATAAPQTLNGTVMVCWKKSDNVDRALAAAMPFLKSAKRVVIAHVAKRNAGDAEAVHDLARQFVRDGISTDARIIPSNKHGISGLLAAAAEDCRADLLVMGAYGNSRVRELIFGSRTEGLIRDADRPMLLMH